MNGNTNQKEKLFKAIILLFCLSYLEIQRVAYSNYDNQNTCDTLPGQRVQLYDSPQDLRTHVLLPPPEPPYLLVL